MDFEKSLLASIRLSYKRSMDPYQVLLSALVATQPSTYATYSDVLVDVDIVASARINPEATTSMAPSASSRDAQWALYLACRAYVDVRVVLTESEIRAHASRALVTPSDDLIKWILRNSAPNSASPKSYLSRCALWNALCRVSDQSSIIRGHIQRHARESSRAKWLALEARGFQPTEDIDDETLTIVRFSPPSAVPLYTATYHVVRAYDWA